MHIIEIAIRAWVVLLDFTQSHTNRMGILEIKPFRLILFLSTSLSIENMTK